ncbi:MAG: hypothetical protein ACI4GC_01630 [Acutalibacteraceae bacterium]
MKKLFTIILAFTLALSLVACGGNTEIKVDYENEVTFEEALNNGEEMTNKTVTFTVNELSPNSAFGYNLQTGEHLNFCSPNNPGVKVGDTITVKVTEVSSILGSYIISYEIIK